MFFIKYTEVNIASIEQKCLENKMNFFKKYNFIFNPRKKKNVEFNTSCL